MYYLANYEERHAPPTYKHLKRLSDFRNTSWRIEGSKHVVYKCHRDVRLNKVHAFYTVRDGCLVRDKYRTAMHQIRGDVQMKTNVSISLTDEERNIIAKRLQGKEVKSLVTRKELGDLVQGFVHGLLDYEPQTETAKVTQIGQRSLPVTAKLQMYLDKRGYDEDHPSRLGFIRGWHSAGK